MKYRKKPIVIEAIQFQKGMSIFDISEMMKISPMDLLRPMDGEHLYIQTLEGEMVANIGDYIIKGLQGEFYPCKPDIFEATYELVEDMEG